MCDLDRFCKIWSQLRFFFPGAINNKYLLLGLSQLSFFHEPTDLQLFINSGILQLLGNLLSSQQAQLVAANDDKKNKYVLNERVVFSCSQLLQLIAVRTGSLK